MGRGLDRAVRRPGAGSARANCRRGRGAARRRPATARGAPGACACSRGEQLEPGRPVARGSAAAQPAGQVHLVDVAGAQVLEHPPHARAGGARAAPRLERPEREARRSARRRHAPAAPAAGRPPPRRAPRSARCPRPARRPRRRRRSGTRAGPARRRAAGGRAGARSGGPDRRRGSPTRHGRPGPAPPRPPAPRAQASSSSASDAPRTTRTGSQATYSRSRPSSPAPGDVSQQAARPRPSPARRLGWRRTRRASGDDDHGAGLPADSPSRPSTATKLAQVIERPRAATSPATRRAMHHAGARGSRCCTSSPQHRVAEVDQQHHDGHQLQRGLDLAALAGGDDQPLGRGDAAQAVDRQVAGDQHHHHPGRHAAQRHHEHQHGGDDQLVGQRVEELAQHAHLAAAARQVAVERVGGGRHQVEQRGDEAAQRAVVIDEEQHARDQERPAPS